MFTPNHKWEFEQDPYTHSNKQLRIVQTERYYGYGNVMDTSIDIIVLPEDKAFALYEFLHEFFEGSCY